MSKFSIETQANNESRRNTPMVVRPVTGKTHLWLPFKLAGMHNREWVSSGFGTGQDMKVKEGPNNSWLISRDHTMTAIEKISEISPVTIAFFQFSATQRCNSSCANATGDECVCSCEGAGHGGGAYGALHWTDRGSLALSEECKEIRTVIPQGEGWKFTSVGVAPHHG